MWLQTKTVVSISNIYMLIKYIRSILFYANFTLHVCIFLWVNKTLCKKYSFHKKQNFNACGKDIVLMSSVSLLYMLWILRPIFFQKFYYWHFDTTMLPVVETSFPKYVVTDFCRFSVYLNFYIVSSINWVENVNKLVPFANCSIEFPWIPSLKFTKNIFVKSIILQMKSLSLIIQ